MPACSLPPRGRGAPLEGARRCGSLRLPAVLRGMPIEALDTDEVTLEHAPPQTLVAPASNTTSTL